ncbi:MAG: Uma2 family endonuclease [Simplicispira sp.]|uniref:Uma2 family endonuclease n=1 Tax=Simplicispira sp. TaxID=2015802 RepID=UPI00258F833D|nr:Uma2 family endonuclease [Simplicispira sp.]MDD2690415.1 Uma2 family endonuclease [Simplicispira sp.]
MTSQTQPQAPISIEDYLEGEQHTDTKHEYLAGQVVAMGGASDKHGLIAGSLYAALLPAARRKGCQLFIADMKVRVNHDSDSYCYYPDLLLSCQPDDRESAYYRRHPCLLVEVLSPSTERIDSREKLLAYRLLPSLREYLLLRQDRVQADLYQRGDEGRWEHHTFTQPDDVLALRCLDAAVSLRDVYADVPELLA